MIESGTLLQGRFLVESRIGEGGMGAVYLGVDQKFGSRVAIKETFYGDPQLAEAFEREARLLNGLHHPIFPHVSDHFSENGGHFLVMEFIEGEDMSAILKRGEVFAVEEVMRWTLDLLDGLDYLHSQDPPIIHRDIKPNNLKLTSRGNIVLLDFGMAKETSGNTLGMKSVFGYSRRYSPLEQIEGTGTDHRSDIFSLGATVFHLLTGKPPVDVLARASAIVSGKPDPLQPADAFRSDVPDSVAAILNSALALNPDHRFVSARAMWRALEYALGLDFAHEDTFGEPAVSQHVVVAGGEDFPALHAYRGDGGADPAESQLQEENEIAPPFAAVTDPLNFDEVDPHSVEQVAAVGGTGERGYGTESWNDGVIGETAEPDSHTEEVDAPVDRAVIHLADVDSEEDNAPGATWPDGEDDGRVKVEIPVAAAAAATREGRRVINRRIGSTGVLWLTLLLALLSGLIVYGVLGTSSSEPAVQETLPEPATQQPLVEPETVTVQEQPETVDAPAPENNAPASEVASAEEPPAAEELPPAEETSESNTDTELPAAARNRPSRPDRNDRARDVQVEDEPEPRRTETRTNSPAPARRTPQRQARRRSTADRPRIVDVFEEPRVGTIESVLTGIPYERRRRWRDRWNDDDDFRPRRNRRGWRDRPPFPF